MRPETATRKKEKKKKKNKYDSLERKYRIKTKWIKTVIEELKQRLKVKSAKIRRCENRIKQ